MALLGMLLVGLTAFWPSLAVRPFYADNLISLTQATRGTLWEIWTRTTVTYQPTYRPFAFTALWLQGRVNDLHAPPYYVVNLLVWVACAWVAYAIVYSLIRSKPISALVALAVLVDARAITALWLIIDQQMSLAMLAGLLALLLTVRLARFRRPLPVVAAVGLLLLISPLSKEYGLAFCAAVFLAALVGERKYRRPLVIAAVLAALAYAGIRLGVTGGFSDYCEAQGYFTTRRASGVCLESLDTATRVKQHLYNVGASVIGVPFPSLFSYDGVLTPHSPPKLIAGAIVLGLAIFGVKRRPRAAIPLLGLWFATALLSIYIYRSRNQLIGMFGLYACAGIGLTQLAPLIVTWRWRRLATVAAGALVFVWLGFAASAMRSDLDRIRVREQTDDPCIGLATQTAANVSPQVVEQLKREYGLPDPNCRRSGYERQQPRGDGSLGF